MRFAYPGLGRQLQVDFTDFSILGRPDFDVNALWMRPLVRRLEIRYDVGLSLEDLTAKCARMRFSLIKEQSEDNVGLRASQMLAQGWQFPDRHLPVPE